MGEDDVANLLTKNLEREKAALSRMQTIGKRLAKNRAKGSRVTKDLAAEAIRFGPPSGASLCSKGDFTIERATDLRTSRGTVAPLPDATFG
jgi:hypothetical protein